MKVYNFEDDPKQPLANIDEQYMQEALKLARKAFEEDEIPIGAIIVSNGKIIGKGYNMTERLNDVTAHAEMQAFTAAANYLGGKYLKDCTLYVTVEPCVMCAGASYWTQISKIVYGARDEKRGYSSIHEKIIHPKTIIQSGVLEKDCAELMMSFFRNKR
ncbi:MULTISPECIES: nucleoside deaminase [Sphingobacterium]|uniref:tRNA-specific adenosine deaminase n=1 Tax=Sphingobacterium cellulitidis TaxID=1768011 RepID=A0A8H9G115_9SPHI|nr:MULTISPECIES: nucleoside deaminase [Sphingobacterium]MBA8987937.1 tRNA(adenine34) deaminase [Sphingobacterium soli]OYD41324.1 tRNA-specific adenosine deaminase [Sphingobacterium cellulitidis]OYD45913.1 tRNA-specific adenosine deaminase [Sphingobacterium cellulitidis]WFB62891.1 nucleoside deaminase [Sphingobacterium sp. WM]GGE26004.1 tRNA-specific adenosine deaminase [Sphingobacterium soli]